MLSPSNVVRIAAIALVLGGCKHRRVVRRPPAPPPTPIALDEEPAPRLPPVRPPPPPPPVVVPPPPPAKQEPPPEPPEEQGSLCGRGPGERFVVQGVDAADTLNMRNDPDPRAEVVGQLPPDATGVLAMGEEQRVGSAVWRKVKCHKVVGWVNARFLFPQGEESVAKPEPPREPVREPPRW
jgi:hypothetical protein